MPLYKQALAQAAACERRGDWRGASAARKDAATYLRQDAEFLAMEKAAAQC